MTATVSRTRRLLSAMVAALLVLGAALLVLGVSLERAAELHPRSSSAAESTEQGQHDELAERPERGENKEHTSLPTAAAKLGSGGKGV